MDLRAQHGRWFKGVPAGAADQPLGGLGALGLSLLDDELALPAAVIRRSALDNNRRWMRAFTQRFGLSFAPHGKTTMSPELIAEQLADGAWGMTAATAHHARVYAAIGVPRILMANQLIGRANIAIVMELLSRADAPDFYCLVDSVAGVALLAAAARAAGLPRPVKLLVELGGAGERAGARSTAEAQAVARACAAEGPAVALAGVEAFEGVYADPEAAAALLRRVGETAAAFDAEGLFGTDEVVITAGGSFFVDLAARALLATALPGRPTRLVLRSGCYLTHDSDWYGQGLAAATERDPTLGELGALEPALHVWAHIQSRPEPARAIASLGRRDISHDLALPRPAWTCRPGRDARPVPIETGVSVARLFDQHAYLDIPPYSDLAIGDLIAFGLSHPCTTFDKWRALFVVDDGYRVIGVSTTLF